MGRSILFTTTTAFFPSASAFLSTKRVCGMQPSNASTSSKTPSTICRMRSTSPPKSACPGVSTIFILIPLYITLVFFERIVIPRSRSRSFESITRSLTDSFARKVPLCFKSWSTRVVLPWSTCAIIATFLKFSILAILLLPLLTCLTD